MIKFGNEYMQAGCYADSSYGWAHVREVLSGLVEPYDASLAAELLVDSSDDASEEYEAVDILNGQTIGGYWEIDGDLYLTEDK